uniref:GLUE N-terminal domain-containing protein n=1 Tax=Spongospora subterranea TaxID=70186 RepID=A0A0H5QR38_9EUKA|eukprot:CRZ04495.1 hypothetical protein [Spongospora subterranea]
MNGPPKFDQEIDILSVDEVSVLWQNDRTQFQKGMVTLSTQRIFFLGVKQAHYSMTLGHIKAASPSSSLFSSPKIKIALQNDSVCHLVFHRSGRDLFLSKLSDVMKLMQWLPIANSEPVKKSFTTNSAGICTLLF